MQGSKNQWQVVGKAKKPTPAKGKADQGQPSAKSAASVSVDPAFAVLDREWNAKKLAAAQQSTYSDALPDSSSDVDDDQPQPATSPASKKRRPPKKTKKPKIAEVAAQIIADGSLHATLDDIASKYTEDASARAEALAAYMQRTFELCELAFNKLLLADPRRAAGEPITQLDDACARPVRALLQGVALTDAGVLTISLLDAIVRGQPDTPQGGAAPPKAQVHCYYRSVPFFIYSLFLLCGPPPTPTVRLRLGCCSAWRCWHRRTHLRCWWPVRTSSKGGKSMRAQGAHRCCCGHSTNLRGECYDKRLRFVLHAPSS